MKRILFSSILLSSCILMFSQTLKGKITSTKGDAIPYATIFIFELSQGIVADEQGNFQTKLQNGDYSCEIRSIGYETQSKKITIHVGNNEFQFVLPDKPLTLNELTVNPSKDNPAKRVMLQAIAHAPLYLYQVAAYTATNYMKGSAKIDKIPELVKIMLKDKKLESLIGKVLVLESQSEVSFKSPATYTQKVLAFKSSIPKEMTPKGGMRTSTSSIYQSDFMGYISPLSPQAFQYYRFKLIDIFSSGKLQINKISVTPKLKNEKLLEGFIYIVENDWNVFHLDLSVNDMGTITRYKINYSEVKPQVFMPVSYEMNTTIGTAGVKGNAKFYSSIQYLTVNLNKSSQLFKSNVNQTLVSELQKKANDKVLKKIEIINSKKNLTTQNAKTLTKLLTKTLEPQELSAERESLEVIHTEKVKLDVDSLAEMRDSVFWENTRKVPLQKEEALSFLVKDTLPPSKKVSTSSNSITVSLGTKSTKATNWLFGGNAKLSDKIDLKYDGFLRGILKEYNFVDGFWLGQKLSLNIKTSKTNNLTFSPAIYYTTARKALNWNLNSNYNYAPMSNGNLSLNFGQTTSDIQGEMGTSRFLNSLSSLFFGDNVIRFYQNQFLKLENKIDLVHGLVLNAAFLYENRKLPYNYTGFHFWGKNPRQNYTEKEYMLAFPTNSATTATLLLQYTPAYTYKIQEGKKVYLNSKFPTFGLEYKKAIPVLRQTEQASYDRLKFTIRQAIQISSFDWISYNVQAGSFISKKNLYTPDFNYFATSSLMISNHSFDNSFQFLPNYTFSNKNWVEAHFNLNSEYLILKRLSFLQTQQFNESFHLSMLWSEQFPTSYVEAGYSVGINNLGRLGVFAGFNGLKYEKLGVKLSLTLLK